MHFSSSVFVFYHPFSNCNFCSLLSMFPSSAFVFFITHFPASTVVFIIIVPPQSLFSVIFQLLFPLTNFPASAFAFKKLFFNFSIFFQLQPLFSTIHLRSCCISFLSSRVWLGIFSCVYLQNWKFQTSYFAWCHQMETFSALLALCEGKSPVPLKGQWRGTLKFLWSAPWINGWVNNREAGDMRRHRVHYDAIVMVWNVISIFVIFRCWLHPSPLTTITLRVDLGN